MNSVEWKNTEYYRYYNHKPDSMYKYLKVSSYTPLASFKDFLPKTSNQFMHRTEFLQYIKDYANYFNLNDHIKLNTFVTSIRLSKNISQEERKNFNIEDISKKFVVEYTANQHNINKNEVKTKYYQQFDKVIVCNGHFSVPNIPKILNSEIFKGKIMHSHNFRNPVDYISKVILIVGTSVSGTDLIMQFFLNPILKKTC